MHNIHADYSIGRLEVTRGVAPNYARVLGFAFRVIEGTIFPNTAIHRLILESFITIFHTPQINLFIYTMLQGTPNHKRLQCLMCNRRCNGTIATRHLEIRNIRGNFVHDVRRQITTRHHAMLSDTNHARQKSHLQTAVRQTSRPTSPG